jgi:RNA polymerase sigma factor (sigma-70 family)
MERPLLQPDQLFNIVQGMIKRDESSLSALYECTLPKVYGLALKITRRHDIAEEVVEDTYMQAWQEAARFDSDRGPTMAWLMMICRSRAIDALRRLDEAESHSEPETLKPDIGGENNPLDLLLVLERESDMQQAMASLNALQRQLIALAFFKGYTHEEISVQMQMPLGTVKSNIKRAQIKLRVALTHEESSR